MIHISRDPFPLIVYNSLYLVKIHLISPLLSLNATGEFHTPSSATITIWFRMWNAGLARKNTFGSLHGKCTDRMLMMIKCSHTEGCKPHLSMNVTYGCTDHLLIFTYRSQRFIDWICWICVLAWHLTKCPLLWFFIAQSMKLPGNRCMYDSAVPLRCLERAGLFGGSRLTRLPRSYMQAHRDA